MTGWVTEAHCGAKAPITTRSAAPGASEGQKVALPDESRRRSTTSTPTAEADGRQVFGKSLDVAMKDLGPAPPRRSYRQRSRGHDFEDQADPALCVKRRPDDRTLQARPSAGERTAERRRPLGRHGGAASASQTGRCPVCCGPSRGGERVRCAARPHPPAVAPVLSGVHVLRTALLRREAAALSSSATLRRRSGTRSFLRSALDIDVAPYRGGRDVLFLQRDLRPG